MQLLPPKFKSMVMVSSVILARGPSIQRGIRGRLHELIKWIFSAPISGPYEVSRSVLALKTGPFSAYVDAP